MLITPAHLLPGRYFCLTNKKECHRGFQYKTGLNEDYLEFNPTGECEPGGLYFVHQSQVYHVWIHVYTFTWIREVNLPENEQIWCEGWKYKAKRLILGERVAVTDDNIHEFMGVDWSNEEECMAAVQRNGTSLRYVKDKTHAICMAAVRQDAFALFWVDDQTPELCLVAMKQNGSALQQVKYQTPAICLAAVQQNGRALEYVWPEFREACERELEGSANENKS